MRSIGPLMTPRRVIDALLADEIDIGPLDSYFHDLLLAAEPGIVTRSPADRIPPPLRAQRSNDG